MLDLFSQLETPERDELLALRRELTEANYKYYVENAPQMSDYDFDQKLKRLEALEKAYPDMYDTNSPTQKVGSDLDKPTPPPSLKGREKGERRKVKVLSRLRISIRCYH